MAQIVPSVTVPVTLPSVSEPLTPTTFVGLAREIGIGLRDVTDILATYKLSAADYQKLKADDLFTQLVDAARIEWNSAKNVAARVQIEAAYTAEKVMPAIYARLIDTKEPLNHVVAGAQWLTKLAGLEKIPGSADTGERFNITINFDGGKKLVFDQSLTPTSGGTVLEALPSPSEEKEERV